MDEVERYRERRRKRLEERNDGVLEWITTKTGSHIPIEDGKAVGGPLKGQDFSEAKTSGKKMGEKRGQISVGSGKVPDAELSEFNKKAFESIKEETGYSDKEAKKLHQTLLGYLGGDYSAYTEGKKKDEEKVINEGLARMGAYEGPIYRGMSFYDFDGVGEVDQFVGLDVGDEISMKSISSWSSELGAARDFAEVDRPKMSSVLLSCKNNKSGVGVQHISKFRDYEAEVLAPSTSKWKITGKKVISKWELANELVDEYSNKKELTKREESLLKYLKGQMRFNRPAFENSKFVLLEVDEI